MKAAVPLALLLAASQIAAAQTTGGPAPKPAQLSPLTVTGIVPDMFALPGSAAVVAGEDFRARGYTNLKQIAATAPGVFVRDEDGFGNFPNISIRGVDGTRSAKVTLMEDGILTAPSPTPPRTPTTRRSRAAWRASNPSRARARSCTARTPPAESSISCPPPSRRRNVASSRA